MYTEYFQIERMAFSKSPDPRFFFRNEMYEEALLQLRFALDQREMGLIIGPVGSGKTLLTRVLLDELSENYSVALIVNPILSPYQFLRAVALDLGINASSTCKSDLIDSIQEHLLWLDTEGRQAVLIVDEAHLIPRKQVFDEIRLLTNIQMDDRNLLSVLLVGQLELKKRLRHASYRSFTQRIGAEFEIRPLTLEDTKSYLLHRLHYAGAKRSDLFCDSAIRAIHSASKGIPRLINHIATQTLIETMASGAENVESRAVKRVVSSMMFIN